jgi:hypothetical protein
LNRAQQPENLGDTQFHQAEVIKACSTDIIDKVNLNSLFVIIDGNNVPNLKTFRASEFFSFTGAIPGFAANNCTGVPGHCYEGFHDNTGYTDGYWIMLNPLPPGNHTIHFGGSIPKFHFVLDVTYNLNVVSQ